MSLIADEKSFEAAMAQMRAHVEPKTQGGDAEAIAARGMLAMIPAHARWMITERERGTPPPAVALALADNVLPNIIASHFLGVDFESDEQRTNSVMALMGLLTCGVMARLDGADIETAKIHMVEGSRA
jgi:hypothetical protein